MEFQISTPRGACTSPPEVVTRSIQQVSRLCTTRPFSSTRTNVPPREKIICYLVYISGYIFVSFFYFIICILLFICPLGSWGCSLRRMTTRVCLSPCSPRWLTLSPTSRGFSVSFRRRVCHVFFAFSPLAFFFAFSVFLPCSCVRGIFRSIIHLDSEVTFTYTIERFLFVLSTASVSSKYRVPDLRFQLYIYIYRYNFYCGDSGVHAPWLMHSYLRSRRNRSQYVSQRVITRSLARFSHPQR